MRHSVNKRNVKIVMQVVAIILMGMAIYDYVLEEINRINMKELFLESIIWKLYFILALFGGLVWLFYLMTGKKQIEVSAHIILVFCLICRVTYFVDSCCFWGEVPAYTVFIFGFPSTVALLTEINLLIACKKRAAINQTLVLLNIVIVSAIAICCSIMAISDIIKGLDGYWSSLFYVGITGTLLNIDVENFKGEEL